MGTKDSPAHDPDEQKRWNEGLNALVEHLRTTDYARDARRVAAKLAEFRRDFIADPSKVLDLERYAGSSV